MSVVMVSILIFIILYYFVKMNGIDKRPKYTIGITMGLMSTAKSGYDIKYKYQIASKAFISYEDYDPSAIVPNGRYYVVFDSLNPDASKILFDKPVPENIKQAPLGGWKEIPK
mgnify:CR=1 FL=1